MILYRLVYLTLCCRERCAPDDGSELFTGLPLDCCSNNRTFNPTKWPQVRTDQFLAANQ